MRSLILVLATLLLSSCGHTAEDSVTLARDGIVEWLNLPAAVYDPVADTTFYVYQSYSTTNGSLDAVWVNAYDHKSDRIGIPFQLHAYSPPEDKRPIPDDHGSPAIAINGEGRLVVAYAKHTSRLYYRVSRNTHDHSDWTEEYVLEGDNVTYPQIHLMSDDDLVLIYRSYVGGRGVESTSSTLVRRSMDGGKTWSQAVTIIQEEGVASYVQSWVFENEVHLAMTPYVYAEQRYRDVYHMYSTDGGSTWQGSSGEDIALPATTATMTQVYDDEGVEWSWVYDIKVKASGEPCVLFFREIPNLRTGSGQYTDMKAAYATFRGGKWIVNDIASAAFFGSGVARGIYPCGGSIDPDDPSLVILSRGTSGRDGDNAGCEAKLESWVTDDGGETWDRRARLTAANSGFEIRPQFVKGGTSEMRVVFAHVSAYASTTEWESTLGGVGLVRP